MADKIQELLGEIKNMTNDQIASKMVEIKDAMDNQQKELDKKMGSLDSQRDEAIEKMKADFQEETEKKMAQLVEKIGSAFPDSKPDEKPRFKDFGEFISLVKSQDMAIKDLVENTGNLGGYTVPEQFSNDIKIVELENAVVEPRATVLELYTSMYKMPTIDPSSNADGSQFGGATAYWTDEMAALTESNPTFDRVKLELNKLTAYVEDSNELEKDSVANIGQLLTKLYGQVLAFKKDSAFISGDGVDKPLGILNAPALVTVSRATASQIHPIVFVTMISRFRGSYRNAIITINQSTIPQVYTMKDDNGNYIWHPGMSGSIASGVQGTIYGIPYEITEKNSALGTEGDVILSDWANYLIAKQGDIVVDYSDHYLFKNDARAYRAKCRVDGQPWLKSAITPYKGGSTLSPFVALS